MLDPGRALGDGDRSVCDRLHSLFVSFFPGPLFAACLLSCVFCFVFVSFFSSSSLSPSLSLSLSLLLPQHEFSHREGLTA